VVRCDLEIFAVPQQDHGVMRGAKGHCRAHNGVQHWLHIGGRAADDAQNFARRRLLLQRLVTFTDDPRDLCFVTASEGTATVPGLWRIAAL
jgi:hypothetical protein